MKQPEENMYGSEDSISLRTLRMIDAAVANLRKGVVGEPIDPELVHRLAGFSGTDTLDDGALSD